MRGTRLIFYLLLILLVAAITSWALKDSHREAGTPGPIVEVGQKGREERSEANPNRDDSVLLRPVDSPNLEDDPAFSREPGNEGTLRSLYLQRESLKKDGPSPDEVIAPSIPELIQHVLHSDDPQTKVLALYEIPKAYPDPEAKRALLLALKQGDEKVRLESLMILRRQKDLAALESIREIATRDSSPKVRQVAKQVLQYLENLAKPQQSVGLDSQLLLRFAV